MKKLWNLIWNSETHCDGTKTISTISCYCGLHKGHGGQHSCRICREPFGGATRG